MNEGVTTFYSGGMGAFDSLCESVVRELKQTYPLKLYLIAPYMTQRINRDGKYYMELYDDIIISDLGEVHYKRTITERNKWMGRTIRYNFVLHISFKRRCISNTAIRTEVK